MSIVRHESYDQSGLIERTEIERLNGAVEYRRFDSTLTLVETRPATPDEIVTVDDYEAGLVLDQKANNVSQAVTTLRQWALDAAGTTVTTGNQVAVLQQVVDRLGVFFDRFADLIESKRLD